MKKNSSQINKNKNKIMGDSFLQKADLAKYKNEIQKQNQVRERIFKKLESIINYEFAHNNPVVKEHFSNTEGPLKLQVKFNDAQYEKDFLSDVKQYIVYISSRQIVCSIDENGKFITFSIMSDKLKGFDESFTKISFSDFLNKILPGIKLRNGFGDKAQNSIKEKTQIQIQNLKQNTEMTAQSQANTDTNQIPSTLSELFVWVELFYFTRGYQEGKHYQSLKIDEKNNRINLKANTPVLREKMQELIEMQDEVNLKVGKVSDAATTKRFWIFLPEKTFVPAVPTGITEQKSAPSQALEEERLNALKQAVSLYLKNAKEVNTTNDYSGITVNLSQKMVVISGRNILSAQKIHRLLSKDFKVLPLISGSKSVKVKKQIAKTVEAEGTNSSKGNTVSDQNPFEVLRKEIRSVLNESPFKYGENFASILAKSKYVTVNCISENEAEQICKFLDEKGYNCKQSELRKRQAVLVYGKKVAGSVKVDLSDANLPNLESNSEPKAVEVKATTDKTPQNLAETAINAIAAMLQRCEQIEENSVEVLELSYDALCVGGGTLRIHSSLEDGTEISKPISKEFLIDLFLKNLRK